MKDKGYEIRRFYKDNIELEEVFSKCETIGEVVKAIITSNYFKKLSRDILIFNENKNYDNGIERDDKAYELNVNFKVDLGLREQHMKNIPFKYTHGHNYVEMIYVYDGTYSQQVNGEKITLNAGECCILNPNVKHKDESISMSDTVLFLSISNKVLNEILSEYIKENEILNKFFNEKDKEGRLANQYIIFRNNNNLNCNEIVKTIVKEYFNEEIGTKYILIGYIIRLLHGLTNKYNESKIIGFDRSKENLLFDQIEKYIEKNISDISRERIAEDLHYNANYINTIIKKNRGQTYSEYIANKRLEIAIAFLKSSDLSINSIIKEVGYINKSYFYKIFTSKYGIKPKEFRMMLRDSFYENQ